MYNIYERAMRDCFVTALQSPDRATQNASVLIRNDWILRPTYAYNDFPKGLRTPPERLEPPTKYLYTEHAERNSLYAAARAGISTAGLTMVAIWASCADCARGIIQSGVTTLVRYKIDTPERWGESIEAGETMLREAGVEIVGISKLFPDVKPLLRSGEYWIPNK